VGKSPLMQEVYEHILNADATAVIYGEPGNPAYTKGGLNQWLK